MNSEYEDDDPFAAFFEKAVAILDRVTAERDTLREALSEACDVIKIYAPNDDRLERFTALAAQPAPTEANDQ